MNLRTLDLWPESKSKVELHWESKVQPKERKQLTIEGEHKSRTNVNI